MFYQSNIGRTELLMYRTTKALFTLYCSKPYTAKMIHISLNPFALLILKLLGVIKKPPPLPFSSAAISFLRRCPQRPCSPRAPCFYKLSQVSQPLLPSSYRLRYRLSLLLLVILSAGWISITMPGVIVVLALESWGEWKSLDL